MKITFIGADHEVTGSCHYIEAAGKRMIVDFGMEQGGNTYENAPLPVKASQIDYIFVTHAHIDHTGMLPLLYAQGFGGEIFATPATTDLCDIMLRDSAHIQEFEAEWRNRKGKRKGMDPVTPLYTTEDAVGIMERFRECPYDTVIDVCEGVKIRFNDVGHLLGSSAIEIWLTENNATRKIVFSGDLGNKDQPLLNDPKTVEEADYVVMESTYGDRSHGPHPEYVDALTKVLKRTFDRGGNVVIPSFAVGRTQEMLYFFRQIKERRLVEGHEDFPVYMDSPLALRATSIFNEHTSDCFDDEARELIASGINPISFPGLKLAVTPEESQAINFDETPKVILSASGMCEAGRIKHHLKHNLWRSNSTILFVGYQAMGTLGRALIDGRKDVTLFGEQIHVDAEIMALPGLSGHADREGLIRWLQGFKTPIRRLFLVHGEDSVVDSFAGLLANEYGVTVTAPYSGHIWDLESDKPVALPEPVKREKKSDNTILGTEPPTTPYGRLLGAVEKLSSAARDCKGMANKDLAKYADQILAMIEKMKK